LDDICPALDTDDPADLGAYARYHGKQAADQPAEGPGRDRASNIVLIGNEYYVHLEGVSVFAKGWQKIGHLGALPDTIVRQYSQTGTT